MADVKGLICWDIDGVLLKAPTEHSDWRKLLTAEEFRLYRAVETSPEWQQCLRGQLDVAVLLDRKAEELGCNLLNIAHVLHAWHEKSIQLDEAVLGLLAQISKQGWHTYILSNQDNARARMVRSRLDVEQYVKRWFFSCDVGEVKPDYKYFQKVAQQIQNTPCPCIFIDDVKENLSAPNTLGWITHQYQSYHDLKLFLNRDGLIV